MFLDPLLVSQLRAHIRDCDCTWVLLCLCSRQLGILGVRNQSPLGGNGPFLVLTESGDDLRQTPLLRACIRTGSGSLSGLGLGVVDCGHVLVLPLSLIPQVDFLVQYTSCCGSGRRSGASVGIFIEMLHEILEIYHDSHVDCAIGIQEPQPVYLMVELVGWIQFVDVIRSVCPRKRPSFPTHLLVGSDLLEENSDSRAPRHQRS